MKKRILLFSLIFCLALALQGNTLASPLMNGMGEEKSPAALPVEIIGLPADQLITLTTGASTFQFTLYLKETTAPAASPTAAPGSDTPGAEKGTPTPAPTPETLRLTIETGAPTREDGQLLQSGDYLKAAESLQLAPGQVAPLTINGQLAAASSYRAWIKLSTAQASRLYQVKIVRSAAGKLAVLGGSESGAQFSTQQPEFSGTLSLHLPPDQPAIDNLSLSLGIPARKDGVSTPSNLFTCSVPAKDDPTKLEPCETVCNQKKQCPIAPGDTFLVKISALLPEPAEYQVPLLLIYRQSSQPVQLNISRQTLASHITLAAIPSVMVTRSFGGQVNADLNLRLSETGKRNGEVFLPGISAMVRTASGSNLSSGVSDKRVQFFLKQADGSLKELDPQQDRIPVPANGDMYLTLRILNLGEAGTYKGDVYISGPETTRVTQAFEIKVRDDPWWAIFAIALGVAIAYLVQTLTRRLRARYTALGQIAHEIELLKTVQLPAGDPLLSFLRKSLDDLKTGEVKSDLANRLADIHRRWEHYETIFTHYTATRAFLEKNLPGNASSLQTLDQALAELQDKLQTHDELSADKIQTLDENYQKIFLKLPVDAAKDAGQQVYDNLLENQKTAQDLSSEITALAADLKKVLDAESSDAEKVYAAICEISLRFADCRVRQMKLGLMRCDEERQRTQQPDDPAWNVSKSRAMATRESFTAVLVAIHQRDARGADEFCEASRKLYIGAAIAHLRVLASALGRPLILDEDDWTQSLNALPDLAPSIARADQYYLDGKLAEAALALQEAQQSYFSIQGMLLKHLMEHIKERFAAFAPASNLDQWNALLPDGLAAAQKAFDDLAEKLKKQSAAELFCQWPDLYAAFFAAWAQWVEVYLQRVERYAAQQANLPAGLPDKTAAIGKQVQQAKDAFNGAGSDLSQAENLLDAADQALIDLKPLLSPISPNAAVEKIVVVEPNLITRNLYALPVAALVGATGRGRLPIIDLKRFPGLNLTREVPATPSLPYLASWTIPNPIAGWALPHVFSTLLGQPLVKQPAEELSEKQIKIRQEQVENIAAVVVLGVAVLVGYNSQYLGNPTFGGIDYVNAILWGLGLQGTVSGVVNVMTSTGLWNK